MQPTKENTLYLPIKQVYFDQIIAGNKKEKFREIKTTTPKKYLQTDPAGNLIPDPALVNPAECSGYIDDYYGGVFPFKPRNINIWALLLDTQKSTIQLLLRLPALALNRK
ncbi:MAG: hypothetical protein AB2L24_11645 [Mangrovibacterium sp.]